MGGADVAARAVRRQGNRPAVWTGAPRAFARALGRVARLLPLRRNARVRIARGPRQTAASFRGNLLLFDLLACTAARPRRSVCADRARMGPGRPVAAGMGPEVLSRQDFSHQ